MVSSEGMLTVEANYKNFVTYNDTSPIAIVRNGKTRAVSPSPQENVGDSNQSHTAEALLSGACPVDITRVERAFHSYSMKKGLTANENDQDVDVDPRQSLPFLLHLVEGLLFSGPLGTHEEHSAS